MTRLIRTRIADLPRILLLGAVLALAAVPALAAAPADDGGKRAFTEQISHWETQLKEAEDALKRPGLSDAVFERLQEEVNAINDAAVAVRNEAILESADKKKELSALGPEPAEGEQPESPGVAQQRKTLNKELSTFDEQAKRADLIAIQARELLGEYLTASRERLAKKLLIRGPSPIHPEVWAKAVPEFVTTMANLVAVPIEWLASGTYYMRGVYSLGVLITGLFLAALIGWPLRKWLLRRFGRDPMAMEPSYMRRVLMRGM